MSILDRLVRGINTPSTTPTDGGKKWGNVDETYGSFQIRRRKFVRVVTATETLTAADSGVFLSVRSAAAVVLTLPAVSAALKGVYFEIFNAANQDLTINSTADQMITFNDLDADGVAFSTSSEKVGAGAHVICDGTSWLLSPMAEETQTMSVTT